MKVATGRVVGGKVILEGEPLTEGSVVTVVAREDDETFDVTAEEERALLEAIADDARAQIAAAVSWWAENRPAASGAVREDLDRILGLLSVQPGIGTRARQGKLSGVRRITLSRIRYYVYYRVAGDALQVLAFWHTSRGRGPSLQV